MSSDPNSYTAWAHAQGDALMLPPEQSFLLVVFAVEHDEHPDAALSFTLDDLMKRTRMGPGRVRKALRDLAAIGCIELQFPGSRFHVILRRGTLS